MAEVQKGFTASVDISDASQRDWIVESLPSYKNQLDDSNNQKILRIIARLINTEKNNLLELQKLMLLSYASGETLTEIGKDYGVSRYDDDDDFLRFQIRWQILKANSHTDMSSIKTLIATLLNCGTSDFDIVKTENPHEIKLENIPFNFSSGSHSEKKREILADDLLQVLPAETNLVDINYALTTQTTVFLGATGVLARYEESEVVPIGKFR